MITLSPRKTIPLRLTLLTPVVAIALTLVIGGSNLCDPRLSSG